MIIPPIYQWIVDGVAAGRGTTHARQTPASKMIVTDAARSGTHVFRTPTDVSQADRYGTPPRDENTSIRSPRLNSPVLIGGSTTISPTSTGSQDIGSPKRPTGYVEVRNAQPFNTPINGSSEEKGDTTSTFSKLIRRELSHNSNDDIY